ncbi:hypothetical protein [Microvirga sp. G4-2]|uniref:hypothetical protein n=1 Tax=Microvirga sp. G4-2 TaxID=3434467 RepID=UPI0040440FC8
MPAATSYTFYGVVEDPFVNDFITVDPGAFGYTAGQKITGSLTLSGAAAALWASLPEAERILSLRTSQTSGSSSSRRPLETGRRLTSPRR